MTTNRRFLNNDKDVFAINLNKECDRILGNENSKQYIPDKEKVIMERKKSNKYKKKCISKLYPLSAIDRKVIQNEKRKEIVLDDEECDKKYLYKLDEGLKSFYELNTKEIFDFLKEIHLCRYIDCFLKEGFDLGWYAVSQPDI